MTLSENGAVATKNANDFNFRVAASQVAMRSGRHFAQFTVLNGDDMFFGVIRPGWDVEEEGRAFDVAGHCFYGTHRHGRRYSGQVTRG